MPQWRLYTKLTKEYNINGVQSVSSTFIGLCLQYLSVFPVCADWLLLIDLWHPNWRATRNHHRDPCRLSFTQRACSQAIGPSALVFSPPIKKSFLRHCMLLSYCNMSVRKIYVFLFVNCVFIFRIANTFVASYAMKYSEIFFVIRKFLAYTPPTMHA